jgi:hypothetical protein
MEYDVAVVLLSAVVLLLIAILLGVLYVATRDRREMLDDADDFDARLADMAQRLARLDTEARYLADLAAVHAEIIQLQEEVERLSQERADLLELLAHVTRSLELEIRRLSGQSE